MPVPAYRGTVLLEQGQARKEQTAVTALQSQQQALEAIASQQQSQSLGQTELQLEPQLLPVAATKEVKERKLEALLQRQSEAWKKWMELLKPPKASLFGEQSQAFLRARSLQLAVNKAVEFAGAYGDSIRNHVAPPVFGSVSWFTRREPLMSGLERSFVPFGSWQRPIVATPVGAPSGASGAPRPEAMALGGLGGAIIGRVAPYLRMRPQPRWRKWSGAGRFQAVFHATAVEDSVATLVADNKEAGP
eukprot:Skav211589  [mRNA]  locus=scaffold2962:19629:27810:- [translate_table: standard]